MLSTRNAIEWNTQKRKCVIWLESAGVQSNKWGWQPAEVKVCWKNALDEKKMYMDIYSNTGHNLVHGNTSVMDSNELFYPFL